MSKVVLMSGISGSGKTYHARMLEQSGYVRLSSDEIIATLFGMKFHTLPFEEQKKLTETAMGELHKKLEQYVSSGKDVVIDSCFCKRKTRDFYRKIAKYYGANEVEIHYCDASPDIIRQRILERGNDLNDPNSVPVPIERLEQFFVGFEPPELDENVIIVR